MNILIVTATAAEINPIKDKLVPPKGVKLSFFITGVGPVFMSQYLTQHLMVHQYDLVINIGLAGSYDVDIKLGTTYQVTQDKFIDIGAENQELGFIDLIEINLMDANQEPFNDGWLTNEFRVPDIPLAAALTRSLTTANPSHLAFIKEKYPAALLESMEGASFLLSCQSIGVKCLQLRAVSNYVGDRDQQNWTWNLALENLTDALQSILKYF